MPPVPPLDPPLYLQLDSNHIIVPNVFVYVIPEHTSRADCSVNNNNNNNSNLLRSKLAHLASKGSRQ